MLKKIGLDEPLSQTAFSLILAAFALLTHGAALLPGYSLDDYINNSNIDTSTAHLLLSQGRFGTYFVYKLVNIIGLSPSNLYLAGGLFAITSQVFLAVAVVKFFRLEFRWSSLLAGFIFISHPYMSEILTYRVTNLNVGLSYFLVGLALHDKVPSQEFSKKSLFIRTVAPLFLALTLYQSAINYPLLIVMIGIIPLNHRSEHLDFAWRGNLKVAIKNLLFAIAGAVIVYLATFRFVCYWLHIEPDARSGAISVHDIPNRIIQITQTSLTIWAGNEPILAQATKIVFFILVAITLTTPPASRNWKSNFGLYLFAVPTVIVSSIGISIFLGDWWPVPRVISQVALVYGAVAATLLINVQRDKKWKKLTAFSVAGVIIVAFVLQSNVIFFNQTQVNQADKFTATEIYSRLQTFFGSENVQKVVFVGHMYTYPSLEAGTQGDLNDSAFADAAYAQGAMEIYTGQNLQNPSMADTAAAEIACAKRPVWPNWDATFRLGNLGVVCLPQS